MVLIAHIGVWTPYVNEQTEAALRMIRHVHDVRKFSEGFIVDFESPITDKVSGDIIDTITKFRFVQNVGEYGVSDTLPE
jgi:hypothetical protein